jgi:hypothetical protein
LLVDVDVAWINTFADTGKSICLDDVVFLLGNAILVYGGVG